MLPLVAPPPHPVPRSCPGGLRSRCGQRGGSGFSPPPPSPRRPWRRLQGRAQAARARAARTRRCGCGCGRFTPPTPICAWPLFPDTPVGRVDGGGLVAVAARLMAAGARVAGAGRLPGGGACAVGGLVWGELGGGAPRVPLPRPAPSVGGGDEAAARGGGAGAPMPRGRDRYRPRSVTAVTTVGCAVPAVVRGWRGVRGGWTGPRRGRAPADAYPAAAGGGGRPAPHTPRRGGGGAGGRQH